jgi:hypothetical protein
VRRQQVYSGGVAFFFVRRAGRPPRESIAQTLRFVKRASILHIGLFELLTNVDVAA